MIETKRLDSFMEDSDEPPGKDQKVASEEPSSTGNSKTTNAVRVYHSASSRMDVRPVRGLLDGKRQRSNDDRIHRNQSLLRVWHKHSVLVLN